MSKFSLLLSSLAVFFLAIGLAGCPQTDDPASTEDPSASEEEGHEGHDHAADESHDDPNAEEGSSSADEGDSTSADANKEENLADLSDEDRALVEAQKICPVSEESLWGTETPVKVSVTDAAGVEHQVFICCDGCKGKLEADPDKYLAVLEK